MSLHFLQRAMRLAFVVSVLSIACGQSADAIQDRGLPADESVRIRELVDAYTNGWAKNDAEAVLRTLAPDAILVPAHAHQPISGHDAIRQIWWPPGQTPTAVTAFAQSVDEIDGTASLAYVRGTFTLSFRSGQTPVVERRGAFFMIVRRQADGRWLITRRMWDDALETQQAAPTVEAAIARLQANDARGAATILQQIVDRQPADARLWRLLGIARQKATDLDGALTAYQKALEIDPDYPAPLYNIATVHALKNDTKQAFEWLSRAKRTGKIDMTQVDTDPDLASVRKDGRYRTLLPTPKDFEHPFVEPVTIVREWDGEAANDQFGWIARNIGDVDGDGVADVVTSAPSKNKDAGRVYVYSTKSGRLLWKVDGGAGDELGLGVEGAGDTNGDGIPDVIASAPGRGTAYIYSGSDGRLLQTLSAEHQSDLFGRHVSGVGDIDGDGFADVIVGAPGNAASGNGAGRAYVYSGKDGRLLIALTGEREGDAFGSAVAGYTDRSNRFLVVGAPGAGPRHKGRTYVYAGLTNTPKFVIESDDSGNALGAMFLSIVGDIDGDGTPDIYASDWSNGARGHSTGRIYVHSGRDGRRLITLTGETAGEGFGIGPATAGDVNGDGVPDLIVGAWHYSREAMSAGRAYLFSGRDGALLKTFTCRIPGDTFGFDAVGMGDVDGDGTVDFLITSAWSGVHGFHSGRMFIVSSGVRRRD